MHVSLYKAAFVKKVCQWGGCILLRPAPRQGGRAPGPRSEPVLETRGRQPLTPGQSDRQWPLVSQAAEPRARSEGEGQARVVRLRVGAGPVPVLVSAPVRVCLCPGRDTHNRSGRQEGRARGGEVRTPDP